MSSSKCAAATEHSLGAERKVGVHCHIRDLAMEERGTLVQKQKENTVKEDSFLMMWPGPVYALSSTGGRKDSKVEVLQ